ncbi:MAG: TerB family tellurite resistance protein [Hyphomicrobiales bacterium]
MFDALKSFFTKVSQVDDEIKFDENDHRLATAALLTHAMHSDGVTRDSEREAIKNSLIKQYNVSEDELKELMTGGEQADNSSVDFYAFTSVLKRELDQEGREKIVEMLWDVVLADGVIHELEDNVVWRVAELLGVETRRRVMLRQKVEAKLTASN